MSYDIELKDPVTKETIMLPFEHLMAGGTYQADYDPTTNQFSPKPTREAWLNITYNYSPFYYEATYNDRDFYGDRYEPGKIENLGIRGLYGKSGAESIPMLQRMIRRITDKYVEMEVLANQENLEAMENNIRKLCSALSKSTDAGSLT